MSKQPVKGPEHTVSSPPRLPELNARMRARRAQLGLTGADLAQRAGISPSYVSLIENGAKIPDEDVAAELARALADDEDLYRAWARAARLGPQKLDLLSRLEAASRKPAYLSLVESGQAVPKLAATDEELAARIREVATRLISPSPAGEGEALSGSPAVVGVPVVAEGVDPNELDSAEPAAAAVDTLWLDRRLLGQASAGLFACEVTARSMRHLRGLAQPGDRVVLQRGGRVAPDRICAVRHDGGLVLSRVLVSGRALLLLPGEGESGFDSLELPDERAAGGVLLGSHVLLIRR